MAGSGSEAFDRLRADRRGAGGGTMRQIFGMRFPIEDHDLTPAELKREALIRAKTTACQKCGQEHIGLQCF